MASSLCIHAGGEVVTREQVEGLRTPEPSRANKRWYVPVSHSRLLHEVEDSIHAGGLKIRDEHFALAKDGARFFGLLTLESENGQFASTIGIRNAHDMSCGIRLAIGGRVFVCDNLSFHGDEVVRTPHTKNVYGRLGGLVGLAVGKLIAKRGQLAERFSAYQAEEVIGGKNLNDLILRSYLAGAFPADAIRGVIEEYKAPRHPEFAERENLWRLFNAVTEVLKEYGGIEKHTRALHTVFDAEVSSRLLAGKEAESVALAV